MVACKAEVTISRYALPFHFLEKKIQFNGYFRLTLSNVHSINNTSQFTDSQKKNEMKSIYLIVSTRMQRLKTLKGLEKRLLLPDPVSHSPIRLCLMKQQIEGQNTMFFDVCILFYNTQNFFYDYFPI